MTESRLVVGVAIAWLGLAAHNALSLGLPLTALENAGPLAVWAGLLVWHRLSRATDAARLGLLLWTAVNLVIGGILSVIPLPMWPFIPEQTVPHYTAHAIYALAQLPLLWLLLRPSPRTSVA